MGMHLPLLLSISLPSLPHLSLPPSRICLSFYSFRLELFFRVARATTRKAASTNIHAHPSAIVFLVNDSSNVLPTISQVLLKHNAATRNATQRNATQRHSTRQLTIPTSQTQIRFTYVPHRYRQTIFPSSCSQDSPGPPLSSHYTLLLSPPILTVSPPLWARLPRYSYS